MVRRVRTGKAGESVTHAFKGDLATSLFADVASLDESVLNLLESVNVEVAFLRDECALSLANGRGVTWVEELLALEWV